MKYFILISSMLSVLFLSCAFEFIYSKKIHSEIEEQDYCKMIEELVLERKVWKTGNYHANSIIPKLYKASKLESHANKGIAGFTYPNDSVFYSDIKMWSAFFKCDSL